MKRLITLLSLSAFSLPSFSNGEELPDIVDFNDHVQPILSEYCYHCHGPDSSTRAPKKNPLRLDREEYAFLLRPNGQPTIIKGDPDGSDFIKRIISTDINDVMPPPESHKKPLKPEKVALLKKWIEQGAPYEEHWSFIPPTRSEVPEIDWGYNTIDKFIAAKHQEKNLEPSPTEEPARLLRRLSFDLTGLPPTADEVASFREMAAKDLTTAIELTTAKLLATDSYAEHFGRHWLDAARYGDTHGIHYDNYRAIWPYRDWVIEAFRQNMPFDQFTREQIAGDLMPDASLEQKIATGFSRCIPTTGEGGAIEKEYEAIYASDQVATTSAVWLGLTTACAACHDHKFDPISQKDFYALTAFFRNTTMQAMDHNKADHPPNVFAPRIEDRERWNTLSKQVSQIDQTLAERRKEGSEDFENWLAGLEAPASFIKADLSLPLVVSAQKITAHSDGKHESFDFPHKTNRVPGLGEVTHISGINLPLGELAIFDARDQVSLGGFIYLDGPTNGPIISRMDDSSQHRGWDLWIEKNRIGAHIIDRWPNKAIKAVSDEPLEEGKWHHIMVTYDGLAPAGESLTIYLNGKAVSSTYQSKTQVDSLLTKVPTRLGARSPSHELRGSAGFHGFQFFKRKLSPPEIEKVSQQSYLDGLLASTEGKKNTAFTQLLRDHFVNTIDPKTKELVASKTRLLDELDTLRTRGSATLVMEEKEGDAFAHILDRGEYSLEKEKVYAEIPELFQTEKSDRKKSRLDLANWLVSEKNPLTARVTVNRIWYYFFGRGIVETNEDFGIMGARPSHQELLDYLALELMENAWDLQHIKKLITSSATYQQSGKTTSANREKDQENIYLWRAPRHRLEAEQIRDLALASSGLLVDQIGGPSVKPYQPDGLWESVAMVGSDTRFYKQDQGDGLYRRSVYTFVKRNAAAPSMEILNAPNREVFCVRRDRTNTPLAAFVTMNDIQFIESSRALATRAMKVNESFSQRLDFITLALMARTLNNAEQEIVKTAFDHHLESYQEKKDLAAQLLALGESKVDSSLDQAQLAAWTMIASQIFNLDETLTK